MQQAIFIFIGASFGMGLGLYIGGSAMNLNEEIEKVLEQVELSELFVKELMNNEHLYYENKMAIKTTLNDASKIIKTLKQERDDYREALEFYAYPPKDDDAYDKWADDTGEIAKQALEKYTSAELPTVTRRGKGE